MQRLTKNMSGSCLAARTRISRRRLLADLSRWNEPDTEGPPEDLEAGDIVLGGINRDDDVSEDSQTEVPVRKVFTLERDKVTLLAPQDSGLESIRRR